MITSSRLIKKRAKLSALVALTMAAGLAVLSRGTAFAASASVSPGYQQTCQYGSASWDTSWGDAPNYVVTFRTGGDGGGFDYSGDGSVTGLTYNDSFSYAGRFGQSLKVRDYYGSTSASSTTNVLQGGVGGCPLRPAP